jgi:hypothetical protein
MDNVVIIEIKIPPKDLKEKGLEEIPTIEKLNALQHEDGILEVLNIPILCADKISYRDRLRRKPQGSFEVVYRGQYRTFLITPHADKDNEKGRDQINVMLERLAKHGVVVDQMGNHEDGDIYMIAYREPLNEPADILLRNEATFLWTKTQLSPVFLQKKITS